MIPMILKLKIPQKNKSYRNIYLPLFLAWLFLVPVILFLIPFFIFVAIMFWASGYGRVLLFILPLLIYLVWNLQGLTIDIEHKQNTIFMSFI